MRCKACNVILLPITNPIDKISDELCIKCYIESLEGEDTFFDESVETLEEYMARSEREAQ